MRLCLPRRGKAGLQIDQKRNALSVPAQIFQRILPLLAGKARVHLNDSFSGKYLRTCGQLHLRVGKLRAEFRFAAVIKRPTQGKGFVLRARDGKDALGPPQQICAAPGDIRFPVKGHRCAAVADDGAPLAIGQKMHLRAHGIRRRDFPSSRRHALGALRRFAQLHVAEDRGPGGNLLLEQAACSRHPVVPHKTVLHRKSLERIANGYHAHPDMVRHIAAHHCILLPVDALRAEISGLIKAAAPRHLHLFELIEIFERRLRFKRKQQKGGIRRDHQFVVQPSLQAELLHAMRLILIIQLWVKCVKPALRDTPWDIFPAHPSLLAIGAKAHGFLAQRPIVQRQKEMGHIVFKHRARPGDRARVPALPRKHPPERTPVLFGCLPPAHGVKAHHARLAHEQIVIGAGQLTRLRIETDMKKLAARIVKRG